MAKMNGHFFGCSGKKGLHKRGSSLDERLTVSSAAGVRLRAWPPEVDDEQAVRERLWLRGGFPDSYLAATDEH